MLFMVLQNLGPPYILRETFPRKREQECLRVNFFTRAGKTLHETASNT